MAGYTVEKNPLGNLSKTQSIVLASMIFAVALVLSIVENILPPLPIPVPGVKFGLSNIAVMYALFFLGWKQAYVIAVLKGGFVFITRHYCGRFEPFRGNTIRNGDAFAPVAVRREDLIPQYQHFRSGIT